MPPKRKDKRERSGNGKKPCAPSHNQAGIVININKKSAKNIETSQAINTTIAQHTDSGGASSIEETFRTEHLEKKKNENVNTSGKGNAQHSRRIFAKNYDTWVAISSIAVAIISIVCAYHIYYIQRSDKSLRIALTDKYSREESLIESIIGDLTQNEVVTYIGVKVTNSGNLPILVDDFAKPLILKFPQDLKSVELLSVHCKPQDLDPHIKTEKNVVTISPLLLNQQDEINLFFEVRHKKGELPAIPLKATSRIAGIQQVQVSNQ